VDTHYALTVFYTMSGGADQGSDYTLSGPAGQVVIPAGQSSATVTLDAILDHVQEKTQRATMDLTANANYHLLNNTSSSTVSILNAP
jgi:hypothetical protein